MTKKATIVEKESTYLENILFCTDCLFCQVRLAERKGQPIPPGWGVDKNGKVRACVCVRACVRACVRMPPILLPAINQ